jgi:hypothetical protein
MRQRLIDVRTAVTQTGPHMARAAHEIQDDEQQYGPCAEDEAPQEEPCTHTFVAAPAPRTLSNVLTRDPYQLCRERGPEGDDPGDSDPGPGQFPGLEHPPSE